MSNDGCEVIHVDSGKCNYTLILSPGAIEHHATTYGDISIAQSATDCNTNKMTEA